MMTYQEIATHPGLHRYILCYWKFEVRNAGSAHKYIRHYIIPDACSSLIFCRDPDQGEFISLKGPTKYVTETQVNTKAIYIGARFKPGVLSHLFALSGDQLRDRVIVPAPILAGFNYSKIFENITSDNQLFKLLDEEFLKILKASV